MKNNAHAFSCGIVFGYLKPFKTQSVKFYGARVNPLKAQSLTICTTHPVWRRGRIPPP
jgi:hypothetical protein